MSIPYFDFIVIALLVLLAVGFFAIVFFLRKLHQQMQEKQEEIHIRRITRGTGAIHTGVNRKLQTDITATDMEEMRRKTLVHLPSYGGKEIIRMDLPDRWNKIHPQKWTDPWKDEFYGTNNNSEKMKMFDPSFAKID